MKEYLKQFEQCMEKEVPYCTGECPFHMDVKNFIEKVSRGSMKAAYRAYRDAVGYPAIVNQLCDAPCKNVCPRAEHGGSVELHELERACIDLSGNVPPTDYNLPDKKGQIAIIGAGPSGMSALLRLAAKKYHVEVFEKSDRIGGHLWGEMDPDVFLKDFELQLSVHEHVIHYDSEVTDLKSLVSNTGEPFDAVYVATGAGGEDFGILHENEDPDTAYCCRSGETACFAGGELIGYDPLMAMAGGLAMGVIIDNYLKTKKLYYPKISTGTRMCSDVVYIDDERSSVTASGDIYSKPEAMEEASRCVHCRCSVCSKHCDLVEYTNKWPLQIKDEVQATILEGHSMIKVTPAKRMMSLCNHCGVCKEVCPENIDMDRLFIEGRQKMHQQGKMPWAFHEFWLRDMDQAINEAGGLIMPENMNEVSYLFFPGCQLGASEPDLVLKTYEALKQHQENTGILLSCCGIPAKWAGDAEKYRGILENIRTRWEETGKPVMIMGCMTCLKEFRENLPEIPVVTLFEYMAEWYEAKHEVNGEYCVFDPCAARNEESSADAVRSLAESAGVMLKSLQKNNRFFSCCGHGGNGEIADGEYTRYVAGKRINEDSAPYITYCINCRDLFIREGKDAVHILELMFGDTEQNKKELTVTERQQNRIYLKKKITGLPDREDRMTDKECNRSRVKIPQPLQAKLSALRVLEDDVIHTLEFCMKHNRTVYDREADTYSGYSMIGHMTLWIEFRKLEDDCYELVNAYTHRVKIELEAVWNGIKQDIDLQ